VCERDRRNRYLGTASFEVRDGQGRKDLDEQALCLANISSLDSLVADTPPVTFKP